MLNANVFRNPRQKVRVLKHFNQNPTCMDAAETAANPTASIRTGPHDRELRCLSRCLQNSFRLPPSVPHELEARLRFRGFRGGRLQEFIANRDQEMGGGN